MTRIFERRSVSISHLNITRGSEFKAIIFVLNIQIFFPISVHFVIFVFQVHISHIFFKTDTWTQRIIFYTRCTIPFIMNFLEIGKK